jgi:hypothetical protein
MLIFQTRAHGEFLPQRFSYQIKSKNKKNQNMKLKITKPVWKTRFPLPKKKNNLDVCPTRQRLGETSLLGRQTAGRSPM